MTLRPLLTATLAILGSITTALAADPVVSKVTAAQRPGAKLVDITYDVTADTPMVDCEAEPVHLHITQQDPDGDFTWQKFSFAERSITGGLLYEVTNFTTYFI